MDAAALLLVLTLATPDALPARPFGQLPPERICELCFQQADADCHEIGRRLEIVGGWQRHRLLEVQAEACRTRTIWYAAWWLRWSKVTSEQAEEWSGVLVGLVGADDFWRGELPLPLSLRR